MKKETIEERIKRLREEKLYDEEILIKIELDLFNKKTPSKEDYKEYASNKSKKPKKLIPHKEIIFNIRRVRDLSNECILNKLHYFQVYEEYYKDDFHYIVYPFLRSYKKTYSCSFDDYKATILYTLFLCIEEYDYSNDAKQNFTLVCRRDIIDALDKLSTKAKKIRREKELDAIILKKYIRENIYNKLFDLITLSDFDKILSILNLEYDIPATSLKDLSDVSIETISTYDIIFPIGLRKQSNYHYQDYNLPRAISKKNIDNTYSIIDGYKRINAAIQNDLKEVQVIVLS
jgi:hypothetical protein